MDFYNEIEFGEKVICFSHAVILKTILWDFDIYISKLKNLSATHLEIDENGSVFLESIFEGID